MKVKAIIMDVDGTLINKAGKITPKTKEALLEAQKNGVKLILASGRPVNGLTSLAKELHMEENHGYLVCFNGSKVVDFQTGEILLNQTMSVELGKRILAHMKKFEVRPLIVKGDYSYVTNVYDCMVHINGEEFNIMNHEAHDNGFMLCEVKDLEEFADFPLNKILNIGEPEYLKEHYQEMQAPFLEVTNASFTAPFYFEFTDKGIDKTKALGEVLSKIGYCPEELIAFGDAQNDLSMLKYAGTGVAMGNAVEELKEQADFVTASCDEDGIALALEKYL